MSYTNAPNSTQRTSQDDTLKLPTKTPETLKANQLKKPISELIWENRILRTVIKELERANTEAGVEKRLTETRIGIFEKIDADYCMHFTDAQSKLIKAWMAQSTEISRNRMNFDVSGADVDREVYECSIKSWRDLYTRQDDIEIILSLLFTAQQTTDKLLAKTDRLTELKSEIAGHEKKLKVQNNVVASIQEREKISAAEMKSRHEKELKEQKDIIAGLKVKEKILATETKSKYEEMLKEQANTIADIEKRENMAVAETKSKYEKKLKEQREIIANLKGKERSSISQVKGEYEGKLKEQSSIIAGLEEEKVTSAAEMNGLRRELAAHSEVSVSILSRKRELMKPFESRNDHVIETGNISAHGGTCLADVFRIKSNADVDDSPWFEEQYGVPIDTVERFGGSAAFAKLVNMRYDIHNCKTEQRTTALEFERGFQDLLVGGLEKDTKITPESIDGFLLKSKKGKETFQKLCSIWDITRASQRKRFQESRDPKKRSFFGGSTKSNASTWTGETVRRSKLDKIEEYGKDILSSAKDAMPWVKR
ncbi:hypothetical protein EAF04_001329 [Stromatinia cepivora]|nr:hypothetical protein EAF04_001329 [Stromatinia cepivora]